MTGQYNYKVKINDFIDTDIEDWVIEEIDEVYKIHQFKLHLWYNVEGEIKPTQLKKFVEKYETQLHFKTRLLQQLSCLLKISYGMMFYP